MQCPICQVDLLMSEKQGIEIDYCPKCRGVWLDRGELEKIIERTIPTHAPQPAAQASQPPAYANQPAPNTYQPNQGSGYYQEHDRHGHHDEHGKGRRRKSFLEDLFD